MLRAVLWGVQAHILGYAFYIPGLILPMIVITKQLYQIFGVRRLSRAAYRQVADADDRNTKTL